jgi:hypothetical protein
MLKDAAEDVVDAWLAPQVHASEAEVSCSSKRGKPLSQMRVVLSCGWFAESCHWLERASYLLNVKRSRIQARELSQRKIQNGCDD